MMKKQRNLSESTWKTLSSRQIYQNKWLSLREDLVELPDGRTTTYGVVTCGDCVGILPFLDPNTVLLIKQYRYIAKRVIWEMPTGGVHPGESIEEAAQRELGEEIGYRAGKLTWVSTYHTSKSVMDETAHLFLSPKGRALGLQCQTLSQLAADLLQTLPEDLRRYEGQEIRLPGSKGRRQRFRVAERTGWMRKVGPVKVVFSRRLSDGRFLVLVTDAFTLSAREVVAAYRARWASGPEGGGGDPEAAQTASGSRPLSNHALRRGGPSPLFRPCWPG